MKNAITTLRIQNFKSIKDVEIKPRRVNLILGEPNVGKSNVLEAMSLLGGMVYDKEGSKFMNGQVRYEVIQNLFFDNDWSKKIVVQAAKIGDAQLEKLGNNVRFSYKIPGPTLAERDILRREHIERTLSEPDFNASLFLPALYELGNFVDKAGMVDSPNVMTGQKIPFVRKYNFSHYSRHDLAYDYEFLNPPFGDNLLDVIKAASSDFRKEISPFFTDYGLNMALRMDNRSLEIQKNSDGLITSIPYSLIADTLQRLIFYLAAIESNDDAVLLFEEPEAHSYPTYISQLGRRVVESDNNQFFIVTHSPYLVTEILEEMVPNDKLFPQLVIFVAYYEDYQTKIRQLTDEEVIQARADGLDMFYNLSRFIPQRA